MIDRTTLGEVNGLIEFMGSEDTIEVITAFETIKLVKRGGTFQLTSITTSRGTAGTRGLKLVKVPFLNDMGYFIMYPPSLGNREFMKTKEVQEIRRNDTVIYSLKRT